jgi:hypothetical protein
MAGRSFIVVPFIADRSAALHPASPLRVRTWAYARLVAEQAAPSYAGVALIEQPADEFEEPRLVAAIGRVTKTVSALLPARSSARAGTRANSPRIAKHG